MRVAIFDLETSGLNAESSILLCCSFKTYEPDNVGTKRNKHKVTTIRADAFPEWKNDRLNQKSFIKAVSEALSDYDILVAHNGQWFDKPYFNSLCLKYELPPMMRYKKLIDPVQLSRRHLRLSRNSLHSLIDFLKIPEHKTPIHFDRWLQAAILGDKRCMDEICLHCHYDIITLEMVYHKVRCLVKNVDEKGSSF